jgi:hypothetical protein
VADISSIIGEQEMTFLSGKRHPNSPESLGIDTLIRPFTSSVWMLTLVAIVTLVFFFTISSVLRDDLFVGKGNNIERAKIINKLAENFWIIWRAFLSQG